MWYVVTFLVGGIPAIILYFQKRSKSNKLDKANERAEKFRGLVERLREDLEESDDDNDRLKRAIKSATEQADSLSNQIAASIKVASARGDGESVSDLINANIERVRKLSETISDSGNKDAELRRRHRAATVDSRTGR